MSVALAKLPTRLKCEIAIPSGLRQGRVLVHLRKFSPDVLELLPAGGNKAPTHQIVDVWGKPLLTHLSQYDANMSGELAGVGYWEFAESMALVGLSRPGMTVVDAGAHVGYYSALLAHTLGAAGRVIAFEPESRNLHVLVANALLLQQLYSQAAPITIVPCGLADQVGSARLNVFDENSGMHSLKHGAKKAVEMVQVTTLDSLSEGSDGLALGRVDLIKADVRGSELPLILGAGRILQQDRPIMCLSFEPAAHGPDVCVALVEKLRALEYTKFRMFNTRAAESYRLLAEAVSLWTADEVIDQVRRKITGAQATLLAFPEGRPQAHEPVYERSAGSREA